MWYILVFLLKALFTVWYLVRIVLQFLWKLSPSDINWTCNTFDFEHDESEGYYCKNIIDFWTNTYSQSDEVMKRWQATRADEYY